MGGRTGVRRRDGRTRRGLVVGLPASARHCYRGVGETSVYVDGAARAQGIGKRLVEHQITAAETAGFWTLQTSIYPENRASLRIHEAAGFRVVGRRERIAQLNGLWRDTVVLEWRSVTP